MAAEMKTKSAANGDASPRADNDNVAGAPPSANAIRITPTPFVWIDPDTLPRRQWLYGTHLIRREISATFAPGGVGKTSLYIVEGLVLVSGRPLLGIQPNDKYRVWIWNGEEPEEEMQRRIMAVCKHYDLGPDDINERLFTDLGLKTPLVLTEQTHGETKIQVPMVNAVTQALIDARIDVMIVDPFVSTHNVTENDNNAMQKAATAWKQVAHDANVAIGLAHHTRKLNGQDATADDGRGGSALRDKCRDVRVLNQMSAADATSLGVNEMDRFDYFWTGPGGKANMARRTSGKIWFRTVGESVGVRSGNLDRGDSVGVVEAWAAPKVNQEIAPEHIEALQKIMGGTPWRAAPQSSNRKDWIGVAVAAAFGIEMSAPASKQCVNAMVKKLDSRGIIRKSSEKDSNRHDVPVYLFQSAQWDEQGQEPDLRECGSSAGVEPAQESGT
jgi:hypothetical protein